jgi:hypothetical protein
LDFIKNPTSNGEYKWLPVVSPESNEVELLLDQMGFAPAKIKNTCGNLIPLVEG